MICTWFSVVASVPTVSLNVLRTLLVVPATTVPAPVCPASLFANVMVGTDAAVVTVVVLESALSQDAPIVRTRQ